jgi:Tol biopolymer transport system component
MHSWPTWSPDARRVAATRVDLGARPSVGVYVYPADGGESTPVMITPEASPFFAAWSPDGRALAILAREPDGVGLHVRRADGLGGRRLAVGEPLYLAWRPDGRALVAHIDGDAGDVPTARVLVLPVDGAAPSRLLTAPSAFRAPAVGRLTTVVGGVDAAGQHTILAVDAAGTARPLATGGWSPAFALSPRGDRLALGREVAGARGVLDGVEVIDLETGAVERWHNGPVVAFFWSPDGARLAWAGVDWSAVELEWRVASRPGDAHRIAALRPSEQFAATLAFFDQYAATTGVWSPDGRALVVSGWTGGLVDGPSRVWMLDAAGASPPRSLAEGVMASWSPR